MAMSPAQPMTLWSAHDRIPVPMDAVARAEANLGEPRNSLAVSRSVGRIT